MFSSDYDLVGTRYRRRQPPASLPYRLCVVALVLATNWANTASAGTGNAQVITRGRNVNGVIVHVDSRWLDGNGYRPMRVTISMLKGVARRDRTFEVGIGPYVGYRGRAGGEYRKKLTLKAGTTATSIVIPMLQSSELSNARVNVYEGGELLEDVSALMSGATYQDEEFWTEVFPSVLFLDKDVPDFQSTNLTDLDGSKGTNALPDYRVFASMFPQNGHYGLIDGDSRLKPVSDRTLYEQLIHAPKYMYLRPADAPTAPILYSSIDIVMMSADDLTAMAASHPDQMSVLLQAIRQGTALIVHSESDQDAEIAAALSADLNFVNAPKRNASLNQHEGFQYWDTWVGQYQYQNRSANINVLLDDIENSPRNSRSPKLGKLPTPAPRIVVAPLGLGRVVAMQNVECFPGHAADWIRVLDAIGRRNHRWSSRYGISMKQYNEGFWELTVPGVGSAPVLTFLFGISLFVIVIGPVNYFFLRRVRRLPMLLATVPAGAILVTTTLVSYTLFSDGLSTRVRARSYTLIDNSESAQKHAVSFGRQSYYSGFAPSSGLSFPTDITVLPMYDPADDDYRQRRRSNKRLEWGPEEARFTGDFFRSRIPVQFALARCRPTELNVAVKQASANGKVTVRNELKQAARFLVVKDQSGAWHIGRNVIVDQAVELQPIAEADLRLELSEYYSNTEPATPEGMDTQSMRFYRNYYGYNHSYIDSQIQDTMNNRNCILEDRLNDAWRVSSKIPPRSYIAFVDSSPELPLGTLVLSEELSLHVVQGSW